MPTLPRSRRVRSAGRLAVAVATLALLAGCGSDGSTDTAANDAAATDAAATDARAAGDIADASSAGATVSAQEAAAVIGERDVVVLDVRTPEEFAEGHLAGARNIDFYADDFADQLATLDPTVEYVLYCRSGNRSGQTMPILADLGFERVTEIDGGILAWAEADLPIE